MKLTRRQALAVTAGAAVNRIPAAQAATRHRSKVPLKLGLVTYNWGSWDTHGNNFNCLKDSLLPEFDRGYSALIEDLSDRGLLDTTLL